MIKDVLYGYLASIPKEWIAIIDRLRLNLAIREAKRCSSITRKRHYVIAYRGNSEYTRYKVFNRAMIIKLKDDGIIPKHFSIDQVLAISVYYTPEVRITRA